MIGLTVHAVLFGLSGLIRRLVMPKSRRLRSDWIWLALISGILSAPFYWASLFPPAPLDFD